MTKESAVNWLNRRLAMKTNLDSVDVAFIREYVHHYAGASVTSDQVINSIHNRPDMTVIIDYMINKLVTDFDIKVEVESVPIGMGNFNAFMGVPANANKVIKYS